MSTSIRKEADKVPEPTLRRLPWYLSNIKLMKEKGEQYVSSTQISKEIILTHPKSPKICRTSIYRGVREWGITLTH